MNCKFCSSSRIIVQKCKCGIPCIVHCKNCKKNDYESIPHKRQED